MVFSEDGWSHLRRKILKRESIKILIINTFAYKSQIQAKWFGNFRKYVFCCHTEEEKDKRLNPWVVLSITGQIFRNCLALVHPKIGCLSGNIGIAGRSVFIIECLFDEPSHRDLKNSVLTDHMSSDFIWDFYNSSSNWSIIKYLRFMKWENKARLIFPFQDHFVLCIWLL